VKRINNMKIQGIRCYCGRVLFSRARHDFRYCTCGECYVDGGFDYIRCGWTNGKPSPKVVSFELDVESSEIYKDYNLSIDGYGIIEVADQTNMNIQEIKKEEQD
jgi:hypothetical protein